MTAVLIGWLYVGRGTQGKCHVNMEEGIGVMHLGAKECKGFASHHRKLGGGYGKQIFPRSPQTEPTLWYHRPQTSNLQTIRQYISVVSSPVCGALLCQLSESNTLRIYWQKIIWNILRKLDKFTLFPRDAIYQYDPSVRKQKQTDLKAEEGTGSRREKNIWCFRRPLTTRGKLWVSPQK